MLAASCTDWSTFDWIMSAVIIGIFAFAFWFMFLRKSQR